jgi:hypothetical protein
MYNYLFKNGEYIIVDNKYLAEVVGIHGRYFYIVKWYDVPDNFKNYPCATVDSINCRKARELEIIEHLHSLLRI